MREFNITIHSFDEMQAFVSLAMVQPFRVLVCNDTQQINGKNFIGMSSLDYSQPLRVLMDCEEDAFFQFRQAAGRFLA